MVHMANCSVTGSPCFTSSPGANSDPLKLKWCWTAFILNILLIKLCFLEPHFRKWQLLLWVCKFVETALGKRRFQQICANQNSLSRNLNPNGLRFFWRKLKCSDRCCYSCVWCILTMNIIFKIIHNFLIRSVRYFENCDENLQP